MSTPKTGCGCRATGDEPGGRAVLANVLATLAGAAWLARRRRRRT
jgi:MYXO-CTERM domain-containing protein